MCGLYNLSHTPNEVASYFKSHEEVYFPPRDVVAPGQPMGIIRNEDKLEHPAREFALVRWGFVPGWAKEVRPGKPLINARAETIAEKPSFRHAIKRRRCLVPASGFYEWKGDIPGRKQPYFVPRTNGELIGFAGIWEYWMGADGSELESAAIITTAANETLEPIHHRMPAVIHHDQFDAWLDAETPAEKATEMLVPAGNDYFDPRPTELKKPPRKPQLEKKSDQLDLF
ncbi:MAG: SOS response-associated peptidase [Hyphomicrobiales bacterium]